MGGGYKTVPAKAPERMPRSFKEEVKEKRRERSRNVLEEDKPEITSKRTFAKRIRKNITKVRKRGEEIRKASQRSKFWPQNCEPRGTNSKQCRPGQEM